MVSALMKNALIASYRAKHSPLDWMAEVNGPALDEEEWVKRVDAHNTWVSEKREALNRRNEQARLKQLQKEGEETQRRESVMGGNNDISENSLIEKIKSNVHDEQIKLAKGLIEQELVPLIQQAIKEDRDYIDIWSYQLTDWKLISPPQQDESEDWLYHLSTYFQKFEYMLLDENLELKWFEKDGDEWRELYVDRSTEVNSIISIKSSILFQISW